jgi:hypothetical protein
LLTRLRRQNEALEAAWAEFRGRASKYTWDDLMKFLPKAEREEWHEKAFDAAKDGDMHSQLDSTLKPKKLGADGTGARLFG